MKILITITLILFTGYTTITDTGFIYGFGSFIPGKTDTDIINEININES